MPTTYVAVLLDPPHPEARTTYPGVSYLDDGQPVRRIRIRYTGEDGTIRSSNYELDGPQEEADRVGYRYVDDTRWDSASRTDDDWVVDLHPDEVF